MDTKTSQGSIAASTDAADLILVSMEGYVRRSVTLTASGFHVAVLTNILVSGVKGQSRRVVRTSPSTVPRNQENTTSLIQTMLRFLFTVTCSLNQVLYGH